MLVQFGVENFMSFRDWTVFSMLAGSEKEHEEILIESGREKLLPAAWIYGANGAGKTNLFLAMKAALDVILHGTLMQIKPYVLKMDEASSFDFIYTAGKVKYQYGFTADRERIREEYLRVYRTKKPSLVFMRDENEVRFNRRKQYGEIRKERLVLPEVKDAYEWFIHGIDVHMGEETEITDPGFTRCLLELVDMEVSEGKDALKSEGARRLIQMSPLIQKALRTGSVLVVDDLDRSLHPNVVKYLVTLFEERGNGAQLIFSTHDTSLLDLDFARRDQIYFVEKNRRSASSELYALDQFSVIENENIRDGYLRGRFCAIPTISIGDLDIE